MEDRATRITHQAEQQKKRLQLRNTLVMERYGSSIQETVRKYAQQLLKVLSLSLTFLMLFRVSEQLLSAAIDQISQELDDICDSTVRLILDTV